MSTEQSETCECAMCGYRWRHGTDGTHSCIVEMVQNLHLADQVILQMVEQYCSRGTKADGRPEFAHDHMTAGEDATEWLVNRGVIDASQVIDF